MNPEGQNSTFSLRNVVIVLVVLFVGMLLGAFLAPRFSSLPTFLGGFPETTSVPAGDRHLALKVNDVVTHAGEEEISSLYIENQSSQNTNETLCSFVATVKYDATKIKIANLTRSESLPKEFETFSAQNDEKNGTLKVASESKNCNAAMTPEVMELATFQVTTSASVAPGYVPFEVQDSEEGLSQIVSSEKKDVMMRNNETKSGVYIADTMSQAITSVSPTILDAQLGGTVTVSGTNVYAPYYIQGAEDNIGGQKVYYFQNVVPGYSSVQGLLSGGIAAGQYYICSRSLFGIAGENVCSASPLLTVR